MTKPNRYQQYLALTWMDQMLEALDATVIGQVHVRVGDYGKDMELCLKSKGGTPSMEFDHDLADKFERLYPDAVVDDGPFFEYRAYYIERHGQKIWVWFYYAKKEKANEPESPAD